MVEVLYGVDTILCKSCAHLNFWDQVDFYVCIFVCVFPDTLVLHCLVLQFLGEGGAYQACNFSADFPLSFSNTVQK